MTNSIAIKKKIEEKSFNQEMVAERLNISRSTLNLKINNQRSFTIGEMFALGDLLGIDDSDLRAIFFTY